MADTPDKPKLGTRPPLGIKRTVETGKVKQSFSHGRSNTVVVERKQRRVFTKPGEAPPPPVEAPAPVAEAPKPVAPAPTPAAPPQRRLSEAEQIAQRRAELERMQREAEEDRLRQGEEARRREDREQREMSAEERRRAEENRKAGDKAEAEAAEPRPPPPRMSTPAEPGRAPRPRTRIAAPRRPAGGHAPAPKRPEPARPGRGRDEHRQRGKLTVSRALSGEDDSRARSLAALKRAREKERRHHMESGPREKQVRDVDVPEAITVQELAKRMGERGADLVKALFKMGTPVTITETIDQDTAELLIEEFGHRINRVSEADIDIDTSVDVDADETLAVALAGGDHHGPRRPRQDLAARRHPRRQCRVRRGRRDHPAYRRLPGRACPTSRRSPSSTRRATRRSPRCARAAPTSPTSSSWWSRPTTA